MTPKQMRVYGELFKILQEKPKYVAQLAHELSISEIDGEWQLRYQAMLAIEAQLSKLQEVRKRDKDMGVLRRLLTKR